MACSTSSATIGVGRTRETTKRKPGDDFREDSPTQNPLVFIYKITDFYRDFGGSDIQVVWFNFMILKLEIGFVGLMLAFREVSGILTIDYIN